MSEHLQSINVKPGFGPRSVRVEATKACLRECDGEHHFKFEILGVPGNWTLASGSNGPKIQPCNACGNAVGLIKPMFEEIYQVATSDIARLVAANGGR